MSPYHAAHGRGVSINPPNRFERLRYEAELEDEVQDRPGPRTQFLKDTSRSIIATNDSPDVGFSASINPYRGCEHGCAYCYARPSHEYLEVLAEFRNPAAIITKNHLVTRDLDVLAELARHGAVVVFLSVTTLDGELGRTLEPRASQPSGRLAAIEELSRAGVPVGVMVAPIIPGLTDHEMPAILAAAAQAGARFAGYTMLRLPLAVAPIFEQWLSQNAPEKKDKVLARLREIRSGKLNDPRFGSRMRGEGLLAEAIKDLFTMARKRAGIGARDLNLSTAAFRRPGQAQGLLFDC
jgi:DNA repair photolyase